MMPSERPSVKSKSPSSSVQYVPLSSCLILRLLTVTDG